MADANGDAPSDGGGSPVGPASMGGLSADAATAETQPESATPAFSETHLSATQAKSLSSRNSIEPSFSDADQSLATTAAGTPSAVGSVKEGDVASASPYGTRSRNRTVVRPNYSEDVELDFEVDPPKQDAVSSKRSTPSEGTTDALPGTEMSSIPVRGDPPRSFAPINGNADTSNAASGQKALAPKPGSSNPADPPQERKKRKYVWKNGSRPSPTARASHKDSIPGASHFFPGADEADAHPAKKRKTAEGQSTSDQNSAASTGLRKQSITNAARNSARDSCNFSFTKTGAVLKNGKLEADDGPVFAVDDYVYLVCEPPGDPYYLCRIMEFRRDDMDDPKCPVTSMIVNWFYRPKDIGRFSNDPRFLFASMQSDESPLTSLRGKCRISHRSEIKDIDEFRKQRDTFWFNQLYDRYIHRPYEMVPAAAVINVPERVKKAIDERWRFLVVEPARMKELTSAVKLCKRCNSYCAPNDSVDCGVCRNTYHMTCVRPPLAKKPSRGFAWSCAPCSRAQEKKLEQRHTAIIPEPGAEREEDVVEDEEDEAGAIMAAPGSAPPETANDLPETQAEVDHAQMWPWRYLGIHCRVEDVLQYDDRAIYPRASSRLGPRHQANVHVWHGRPVELVKPADIKKKYWRGAPNKKDAKLTKESVAALEADKVEKSKRPKWIQDEPPGYVARGEDYDDSDDKCTARRVFLMHDESKASFAAANAKKSPDEKTVDEFMTKARELCREQGLTRKIFTSGREHLGSEDPDIVPTNYLDKALQLLYANKFNVNVALDALKKIQSPQDFGDPVLTKEEVKKFEDGVGKYGSELRLVRKHLKSRRFYGDIVRHYYGWKKTERGREVWGRHDARRGTRKRAETSWTEIADEEDDSAFDNDKALQRKRKFQCKFCLSTSSRQWRRAPNVAPGAVVLADQSGNSKDKSNQLVVALCQRCAIMWRRYGMRWEDPEEIAKSIQASSSKAWKRKGEEEMLREIVLANEGARVPTGTVAASVAISIGISVTVPPADPRKKKIGQEKETTPVPTGEAPQKKKAPVPPPPRPPTPPIVPQQPRLKEFPCAICQGDETIESLLCCSQCRLTVHPRCYAVPEQPGQAKWVCDTCVNDKTGLYSFNYSCVLCTVAERQPEMVEAPRVTHKKKSDRDKEKERQEKELVDSLAASYKREQQAKGRPLFPREAVKRTSNNNWMHVTCAVWTPEIKFSDATRMESAEGMAAITANPARMDSICKLCRVTGGACIACHQCHATFHVGCAHEAAYKFGFDITPVKGSRKDSISTVALGAESGFMTAAIWCKDHEPKTTVHGIHEMVGDSGLNALQTFVRTYKQTDLALTGTSRKAKIFGSTKSTLQGNASALPARRASLVTNGLTPSKSNLATSPTTHEESHNLPNGVHKASVESEQYHCVTCGVSVALRWWPVDRPRQHNLADPNHSRPGATEQAVECHKCHTAEVQADAETTRVIEMNEEMQPATQKDFFELTMPPPPPPTPPVQPKQPQSLPDGYPPVPKGVDEEDSRNIERWTNNLWSSNVTLHTPTGLSHKFSGRDFGSLNDHPMIAWNYLLGVAQEKLLFDPTKHAIVTTDRFRVTDSNALMQALAKMLKGGVGDSHWFVEDINVQWPRVMPIPASAYRQQQGQGVPRPLLAHGPLPLPPLPAPPPNPITDKTPARPKQTPPYLAPSPHLAPSPPVGVTASLVGNSASPNREIVAPGGASAGTAGGGGGGGGGVGGGASSSPSLKNLMH